MYFSTKMCVLVQKFVCSSTEVYFSTEIYSIPSSTKVEAK